MEAIKTINLTKKYKDVIAVDDLNLIVKKGELFAFLGQNGAGKSTTINIICSRIKRDAGTVEIDGEILDDKSFVKSLSNSSYSLNTSTSANKSNILIFLFIIITIYIYYTIFFSFCKKKVSNDLETLYSYIVCGSSNKSSTLQYSALASLYTVCTWALFKSLTLCSYS